MTRLGATGWLIALPAIVSALALSAIEAYRVVQPGAPLFGGPPPASLADAITRGLGVERAYPFIRGGQDPNAPIVVADANYTDGGPPLHVSPLLLAVAARDTNVALMLLNVGARLDHPQNAKALCLALQMGNAEMIAMLTKYGDASAALECQPRPGGASPSLRDWTQ